MLFKMLKTGKAKRRRMSNFCVMAREQIIFVLADRNKEIRPILGPTRSFVKFMSSYCDNQERAVVNLLNHLRHSNEE